MTIKNLTSIENLKILKYHIFFINILSIISDTCGSKNWKMFKEEEPIEILKILGLIKNMEEYQMNI